jgi:hypothetical protein
LSAARARVGTLDETRRQTLVALTGLIAGCAYLVHRLASDVGTKPLHPDEAVTGLVAARPLAEMLGTVIVERGGPPFYYLAAHVALLLDPSADALRWTSVAFALGTVLLCYDLGRRIAGQMAGATAAVIAATSTMLGQFGTFGRMYAAFAFTAALAVDLFYRALEHRTARATFVAALAAVLVAATHTYGLVFPVVEGIVGLVLWRGRPARAAAPIGLAVLVLVPVVLAYGRLSDRFAVGVEKDASLATPRTAVRQLHYALAGMTGGRVIVLAFVLLAVLGSIVVLQRQPAFLALWATVVVPPFLYLFVSGSSLVALSPRHLIYVLPFWAGLTGAGFARLTGGLPLVVQAVLLGVVGTVVAAFQATGTGDPRAERGFPVATQREQGLAEPASWLRARVEPTDVLYQYAPPYLAALETTQHAVTVAPGPGGLLSQGLDRVDYPATAVVLAQPIAGAELDLDALADALGPGAAIRISPRWLVVRQSGTLSNEEDLLLAIAHVLRTTQNAVRTAPREVERQLHADLRAACDALGMVGSEPADCVGLTPPR